MLRLGYLYTAAKDKEKARDRFKRLANLPEGLDDAARAEAALRLAYLSTGRERGTWAERIVTGQYKGSPDQINDAYRLAAGAAHQRGDLQRAIELYQETPEINGSGSKKSYLYKELAGLYFEVAKGEGLTPIAESVRPEMFAQARTLCIELENTVDAPEVDRMVGELMHAETWLFEGNFQKSYERAAAFLAKWGTDPKKYANQNMRRYINTAKTLQMQNAYIIGKNEEAEVLAKDLVDNRPKKGDEFPNSDSLLIGLEILKLCANDRGDQEAMANFGSRAWQHRSDYIGTERTLQRRRAAWQARAGK